MKCTCSESIHMVRVSTLDAIIVYGYFVEFL